MITVHLYYKGTNGNARAFAEEMETSGIAESIRKEPGNLGYRYFRPLDDPETVLLVDSWTDQAAIDAHHASPMMAQLAALREKQTKDSSGSEERDGRPAVPIAAARRRASGGPRTVLSAADAKAYVRAACRSLT